MNMLTIFAGICDFVRNTSKSKVGDCSRERPEGSFFNSYNTEVLGRTLLFSLDCSTLPSIRTLYCWVLSKEVSSSIFKVFGMTWPGIEPWSPGALANTLPTRSMSLNFVFTFNAFTFSFSAFDKFWWEGSILLFSLVNWNQLNNKYY